MLPLLLFALQAEVTTPPARPPHFTSDDLRLLATFSPPPDLPDSPTNAVANSPLAAELGHALFFDTGLSANGRVSCATCHDPKKGWGDGRTLSQGLSILEKNAPTILGAGHNRWQFWDGRADSLWSQALQPIEHPDEMGGNRLAVAHHLQADEALRSHYEAIFGLLPDFTDRTHYPENALPPPVNLVFGFLPDETQTESSDPRHIAWEKMTSVDQLIVNTVFANVGKALEAFERKIQTGEARLDQFLTDLQEGNEKSLALSLPEQRGLALFMGRAACNLCHFGPRLTDREFHNIGLGVEEGKNFDDGRPAGIEILRLDPFNGRGLFSDSTQWKDNIKLRYLFYDHHTYGAYKTPSLRDVGRTAPYMHDGRFATLEEVLDHYSELPGGPPVGHREETMIPLRFNAQEKADLAAFLRSLNGAPVPERWRTPPAEKLRTKR
jgi:cytochrome c peroxidase